VDYIGIGKEIINIMNDNKDNAIAIPAPEPQVKQANDAAPANVNRLWSEEVCEVMK